MTPGLVWNNLLAYSLQIGFLVGVGAVVPLVVRLNAPRLRLLYWQLLLGACLALPFVRSWRQEVVTGTIQMSTIVTAVSVTAAPVSRPIPFISIALWVAAAGIAIRMIFLVIGMIHLRLYRQRGDVLPHELRIPGTSERATVLVSDDIAGPVTFGWNEPVILLPRSFMSMEPAMRDAIVCHELLHVERRDWLFTIGEELLRAVLWFHPAIWWVIGEIQLSREQTVDQLVIEMTQARDSYVDALLRMAGTSNSFSTEAGRLDLTPAPMFLRRRHLKKRLVEVVKPTQIGAISGARLTCLMSSALALVSLAAWLVTTAFPLSAAPQIVSDANGVAVNVLSAPLLHRSPVPYPADALAKGVEGTVVAQMKVDSAGEVSDASILSGPDELRKGVLQSVLTWHFDHSAANTTQTVNIRFAKPTESQRTSVPVLNPLTFRADTRSVAPPAAAPRPAGIAKIERIAVSGLAEPASDDLLSKLPVHVGDDWTPELLAKTNQVSKAFDPHLTTILARNSDGGLELLLSVPSAGTLPVPMSPPGVSSEPLPPGVFSVGNGTTPPAVISRVDPDYSEQARAAKYGGSVMLSIVVNADGQAEDLRVVKSLGMGLDEEAVKAVQKWRFRPGMNRGVPVKVRAQVEVNFRLL